MFIVKVDGTVKAEVATREEAKKAYKALCNEVGEKLNRQRYDDMARVTTNF